MNDTESTIPVNLAYALANKFASPLSGIGRRVVTGNERQHFEIAVTVATKAPAECPTEAACGIPEECHDATFNDSKAFAKWAIEQHHCVLNGFEQLGNGCNEPAKWGLH